jgi:hypothetical protein
MDKIAKLRLKAKLAEDSGDHQKAYNIRKKIKGLIAKAEYKEKKGPSALGRIIKKAKKKITDVKNDIPKIKKNEKPPVVKKDEKPPIVKADNPQGKPLSSIDKNTSVIKTSLSGTVGLAYGKDGEKGVGSVTKNGVTLKPGDEGFEAAAAELLAQSNRKEETIKRIKKNKKK